MKTELIAIKDYIIQQIKTIYTDASFAKNLDDFLQRLIEKQETPFIIKDELDLKVGRQLLCCIGIDIKSNSVPLNYYLNIFKKIDFGEQADRASRLFANVIRDDYGLIYKETKKQTEAIEYSTLCCISNYSYYFDEGIKGKTSQKFYLKSREVELPVSKPIPIANRISELNKRGELNYFWVAPTADFDSMYLSLDALVDGLGLSHFSFSKKEETSKTDEDKCFFSVKFKNVSLETFKPNATIIDWIAPKTGFLAYKNDDDFGRTFNVTGFYNYDGGVKERVFKILVLNDAIRKDIQANVYPDYLDVMSIQFNDIIKEGINRFNN